MISPILKAALLEAQRPAAVIVANPVLPPTWMCQNDKPGREGETFERVLHANALRAQMQRQTMLAVGAIARRQNAKIATHYVSASGESEKLRVALWAQRHMGILDILACPVVAAADDEDVFTSHPVSEHAESLDMDTVWPYPGPGKQVVFRVHGHEYVGIGHPEARAISGQGILEAALSDSLASLAVTLGSICDVTIGTWPVYTSPGRLELLTPSERLRVSVAKQSAALEQRRKKLDDSILEKVAKHGLASRAEFAELMERAAREQIKVTALIFERTGKRCSSIGTDKIAELISACQDLEQELAGFDQLDGELATLLNSSGQA